MKEIRFDDAFDQLIWSTARGAAERAVYRSMITAVGHPPAYRLSSAAGEALYWEAEGW